MSAVHQRIIDGLTVTVCDAGLAGRGNTNRQGAHRRETRRLAEAA